MLVELQYMSIYVHIPKQILVELSIVIRFKGYVDTILRFIHSANGNF